MDVIVQAKNQARKDRFPTMVISNSLFSIKQMFTHGILLATFRKYNKFCKEEFPMSIASSIELDDRVLKTLDSCLVKMSECLDKTFNPEEKQSLSLFRQFCSAMHSRMQWIKAMAAQILQPNQPKNQDAKPASPSQKPSAPGHLAGPALKNDPKMVAPLSPEPVINGLLLKR